jgi:hypothetical protein
MGRAARRTKRRMACRLIVGSQRFSGVVLDFSSTGIFVQTTAKPSPRDPVTIELSMPGQREPIRLESEVARVFMVPAQLITVAQGGVGLRIRNAPESFFALLEKLQREGQAGSSTPLEGGSGLAPGADPLRSFRVRMTQLGRARTRTLRLRASSAEEAAEIACEESGEGWKVLEASEDEESPAGA